MCRLAAAVVTVAAALGSGAVAAPPPAAAAGRICVGVVVDFRALGGGVRSTCARVADGATGNQVMAAAGHRLGFRGDGLVCTVDGLPRQGCAATDSSHYWAYWHRAPGSATWTYSTQGSGTYRPPNRATEGWVWQDGGAEGSAQPADVPYDRVCPPTPSPTPPPARATAPPSPSPRARATVTSPRAASLSPSSAAAVSASPTAAATSPSAAEPSRTPAAAVGEPPRDTGGGFPVGLPVGLVLAALVGGAALWRSRRP